jgi:hypothetical protein
MRHSEPTSERDQVVRRSAAVFLASIGATGLALFVGFGLAMAACTNALEHAFDGFNLGTIESVEPIPIPQASCPYLRLTAAAAADAAPPWRVAFQPTADWKRFSKDLTVPLANLDAALGATVGHVPAPVAEDLRAVRRDVEYGRVQLFAATSVSDYLTRSRVLEGFTALGHASALVGTACGVSLAPPIPF